MLGHRAGLRGGSFFIAPDCFLPSGWGSRSFWSLFDLAHRLLFGAEIGNLVSKCRRKTGRASSSPALVLFGREFPTGSPRLALFLVATRAPCAQSTLVGGEAVLFILPRGRASACEFSIGYPPHGHKAQSRASFIDNKGERLVSLPYSFVRNFQIASEPGWEESVFIALSPDVLSVGHWCLFGDL